MFLDASQLTAAESYGILGHVVAPRPIALVSSLSADGQANLAPFSFFMTGGSRPPSVVFSPLPDRQKGEKDSLRNVRATGEYVINIVSHPMRESMNLASSPLPHGESEWDLGTFTAAPSQLVKPARVLEAPCALECRLFQIVPHGTANYVIGEVVGFWLRDDVYAEGKVVPERLDLIGRLGGDGYTHVTPESRFNLPRPY